MQRNCTHLNHHFFLSPVLFCFIFISCVYFNTFYNAETSFKKALKIIEESPIIEDGISSQAKKLLGEAVENSKLILKEYPESKYIDDAINSIMKCLNNKKSNGHIINVSSGFPVKIRFIINKICRKIKRGKPIFGKIALRPDEPLKLYSNYQKAKKLLGWKPKTKLNIGLNKTINYYEKRI